MPRKQKAQSEQEEESKETVPTLTPQERAEVLNLEREIIAARVQVSLLEEQKQSLLTYLTSLENTRKALWERICRRLGLNPLKNYIVKEDGALEEAPSTLPVTQP